MNLLPNVQVYGNELHFPEAPSGPFSVTNRVFSPRAASWRGFPGKGPSHLWVQETCILSLDQEDPLEEEMSTHSRILAPRIPQTEEPGRLQSAGLQESDTTEAAEHVLLREAGVPCGGDGSTSPRPGSRREVVLASPPSASYGEHLHVSSVSASWPQGSRPLRVRQASLCVPVARTPRPPDTLEWMN